MTLDDSSYREHLAVIREFVDQLENLQTIGRNGLHRYNNQDHAMLTGMLAVRNSVRGERHDLSGVLIRTRSTKRRPCIGRRSLQLGETLARAFPKLDRLALGVSLGLTAGLILCLASLILVMKGGDVVGPEIAFLPNISPATV